MDVSLNDKYTFPDYYYWPYFYTIQKHSETRLKQLSMWSELVLNYCKDNKVWRMTVSSFANSLGRNSKINRKLSNEAVGIIFNYLVEKRLAMFYQPNEEIFLLWKSLGEWEEFIYSSAIKHQRIDVIETLDYIIGDEDNFNEEYYGMDRDLLVIILKNLEKKKRCMLLVDDNNSYIGVKFFK